nr:MAG TPA: hypothetical protein [Caudoviricetes sp.]
MYLSRDKEFVRILDEKKRDNKYALVEIEAVMFPQIWGSTCTGFDVTENGSPTLGGCAMTKEYTTVIHELVTDTYIIFFGEKMCYEVTNANAEFYEDLQKRQMASLSEAKRRY